MRKMRMTEQAQARPVLLLLVLVFLCLAGGAIWYYRGTKGQGASDGHPETETVTLSAGTRAVLQRLDSPVEIRFYSLVSADDSSGNLREFAGRVNKLLAEFESQASGKLSVTRLDEWSEANTKRAAADGIVPFNLEKGEPAYIGVAVAQDTRKETLAQLAPEWEAALEFDLARAISRVGNPPPAPRAAEEVAQAASAEETVKRAIPDAAATSLEEGKQILRKASLKEFGTVVTEMNVEIEKAEQLILKAETANSETGRQTALQQLQQVRAKYGDKLRDVGRRSQAEMEAWTKLKGQ